jgi:hypothetical protein
MTSSRLPIIVGTTLIVLTSAFIGTAQPARSPMPPVMPTNPSDGIASTAPNAPSPLPSNVATPSPLFANKAYFYRGEDNDPKRHPVPPEVQSGFKRDNHIYCIDWYRMLRSSRRNDWAYYVTTCQCYPEFILRSFGKGEGS